MTTMETWLLAGIEAMKEVGTTVLGHEAVAVVATTPGVEHAEAGAYLALLGDETVELGLIGSVAACAAAARKLLGMEPGDELSDGDMADACCELLNIASGLVKRHPELEAMKTGLPLFVTGHATFREGASATTTELDFDGNHLSLIVVLMDGGASEAKSHVCTRCRREA